MTTEPATYTIDEIAAMLRCSVRHVKNLKASGKIPGLILGAGKISRFARGAVDSWLAGAPAKVGKKAKR